MFLVFREWYLLRRLRLLCEVNDGTMAAIRKVDEDSYQMKDTFLFAIAEKSFWFFLRSTHSKNRRVARDKKILRRSQQRIPALIEEITYFDFTENLLKKGETEDFLKENNIKEGSIKWNGKMSEKDRKLIRLTGEGYAFDFFTAFGEFYKKTIYTYWSLLVILIGAIYGSPWFILARVWLINKIKYLYSILIVLL